MSQAAAPGAGRALTGQPVTAVDRRQIFDLPPMRIEVAEHQLIEQERGCEHRTKGSAPGGAEAPACYGPRVTAVIIYLYIGQSSACRASSTTATRAPESASSSP